jgi:hypothetical protein
MTKDTNTTEVIFRMYRTNPKTCLALFPYADQGQGRVTCYEHIGQHGEACYLSCMGITRPASAEEYADLKSELESHCGYNLKVINRRARR